MSAKTTIPLANGDTARLSFDFSAFARLEDEAGVNVFDKGTLKKLLSPAKIRDIVWAGLLHEQPELTRAEAAKLIALDKLEQITSAVIEAMTLAMPKQSTTVAKR